MVTTTQNRPLTDGSGIPLVADLDGNGINEIIIIDSGTIKLYQNTSLTIVDNINIPAGSNIEYSIPTIFDIDDDGLDEIIIAAENGTGKIFWFEWDGASLTLDGNFTQFIVGLKPLGGSEIMIGCSTFSGEPVCVLAGVENSDIAQEFLIVGSFNASGEIGQKIFLGSANLEAFCLPRVPYITVADYNTDGSDEFIFSSIHTDLGGDEDIEIWWIGLNATFGVVKENQVVITEGITDAWAGGDEFCNKPLPATGQLPGDFLTSPLVGDFNGGGGLETIVGYATSLN